MPILRIETNIPQKKIPDDLPEKLSELLAKMLGKPLSYCAVTIIGDVNMVFGGTREPTAQISLVNVGGLGADVNKKCSKAISEVIDENLGIPATRMYIHFISANPSDVGYNKSTF